MSLSRYELFSRVGRDLFLSGAVTSHGGNLSVRAGDSIFITRRGSMLGRLAEGDLVETSIDECDVDAECSRELVVHRAIYCATGARAIVHAHTTHTIFRSLIEDDIRPIDSESLYVIGASVPVLAPRRTIASPEAAEMLATALQNVSVAVLRSHGPFAIADTLEEAFYRISALEASCRVLDLRDSVGRELR
ncbi:MAG: fuculose phosphate aldolase [Coriobacteriia bacterium]|nr:fuculose phosphate aldolase [Coriobacteriia bacterium]